MNCFQKIVSLIFWTTQTAREKHEAKLWIAFKKLYLWYSEQRHSVSFPTSCCCELLSKNCIFDILNNGFGAGTVDLEVVNCFQKIVSLIFWTTDVFTAPNCLQLWIAFKKLYLWYSEQLKANENGMRTCCELLSKNCIFDILNNENTGIKWVGLVVNCFQKIVSLIFWTTRWGLHDAWNQLWIAFKKLYLWYSEQLLCCENRNQPSCELLSKNCIFDILNNPKQTTTKQAPVVNCFQKIVSLIFWTTPNIFRYWRN